MLPRLWKESRDCTKRASSTGECKKRYEEEWANLTILDRNSDLKPENILIAGDGHIVLTDFGASLPFASSTSVAEVLPLAGLSKDFGHAQLGSPRSADSTSLAVPGKDGELPTPRPHWLSTDSPRSISTPPSMAWLGAQRETTSTFCGTAEYLAPGEWLRLHFHCNERQRLTLPWHPQRSFWESLIRTKSMLGVSARCCTRCSPVSRPSGPRITPQVGQSSLALLASVTNSA